MGRIAEGQAGDRRRRGFESLMSSRTPSDRKHRVEYRVASDVGMRRASNQDAQAVLPADQWPRGHDRGHLFVVADGMGAHAAGELASSMAVETVLSTYRQRTDLSPTAALRQALQDANARIYARGEGQAEFRGMGTTCSALLVLGDGAVAAHVGDSRIYRLRARRLEQLTFDHSLAWELTAAARSLNAHIASTIPRNVITRSLGPNDSVQVDVEGPYPLRPHDTFLLCSDGLTGAVEDQEIAALLATLSLQQAVDTLIALANLRGGPDNTTVIAVRIAPDDASAPVDDSKAPVGKKSVGHRVSWGLCLLMLAASGVSVVWSQWPLAAATFAASLLAAGFAFFSGRSSAAWPAPAVRRGKSGSAPYRTVDCPVNGDLSEMLSNIVSRIRQQAASNASAERLDAALTTVLTDAKTLMDRKQFTEAASTIAAGIRHAADILCQRPAEPTQDDEFVR